MLYIFVKAKKKIIHITIGRFFEVIPVTCAKTFSRGRIHIKIYYKREKYGPKLCDEFDYDHYITIRIFQLSIDVTAESPQGSDDQIAFLRGYPDFYFYIYLSFPINPFQFTYKPILLQVCPEYITTDSTRNPIGISLQEIRKSRITKKKQLKSAHK